jgi:hypothetical protein
LCDFKAMAERKSPERQEDLCTVKACGKPAERSISADAASEAGLEIMEGARRAHLCKDHYKEYKKRSKKDRTLSSLGH